MKTFEIFISEKYSLLWRDGFNDGAIENIYPKKDMDDDYYDGYIAGCRYRILGK